MRFSFRRGMNEVVGSFDRLDQRPGGVAIVDYKTTDNEDAAEATLRARQDANDGQLGLYALAYRETRPEPPAQVEIHFVRSGLVGASPVLPMHFDRAIERIDSAAAGIRAADFTPKPDARTCQACDYSLYCPHSAFKPRA
jgi:RecB family exonuclease